MSQNLCKSFLSLPYLTFVKFEYSSLTKNLTSFSDFANICPRFLCGAIGRLKITTLYYFCYCRQNWLGHKNERRVWNRVFDRDDRYNLAKISYVPYLLSNNINTELVLERPEWEPDFVDPETREVGGEVTGVEELRDDGVYFVRRDINVRPNGRLKITPGVTLKFEHSIGMMVSGEIIAEGDLQVMYSSK